MITSTVDTANHTYTSKRLEVENYFEAIYRDGNEENPCAYVSDDFFIEEVGVKTRVWKYSIYIVDKSGSYHQLWSAPYTTLSGAKTQLFQVLDSIYS